MTFYPLLKVLVNNSDNKLLMAIRITIAGNIIDVVVNKKFDLIEDVMKITKQGFAINDFNSFEKQLSSAKNILYIGDNAGKSAFDKIPIEELGAPVAYVVREIPVINNVNYEDALNSGLWDVAKINLN